MRHLSLVLPLLLLTAPSVEAAGPSVATAAFTVPTLPTLGFIDQAGRARDLSTDVFAGHVVALDFIFTTCSTICPPMGAAFAELQHRVADAHLDVRFVSVSIDPTTDTPPRLAEWAARFGGTSAWTLLTGPDPAANTLLDALGARSTVRGDHLPVVLLGNTADGRWIRANALSPPVELLEILRGLSRPTRRP